MNPTDGYVPAYINKLVIEENEQLRYELEMTKKELQQTKKHLIGLHDNAIVIDKMGRYVEGIRQKQFKPAYLERANIDLIVKIIINNNITDIEKIANMLKVSSSTVRRRLTSNKLYPINKADIQFYFNLFCGG